MARLPSAGAIAIINKARRRTAIGVHRISFIMISGNNPKANKGGKPSRVSAEPLAYDGSLH